MAGGEKRARKEVEALLAQSDLEDEANDTIRTIANNTCGDVVSLGFEGLGVDGARAVAEALRHNTCLKILDLIGSAIAEKGAVALAKILKHDATLKELILRKNAICNDGARALALMLKHNSTLTSLDLSHNSISDHGAEELGQMLQHNTSLKELDLNNNRISDVGAEVLAEMLKHNTAIRNLDLRKNSIGFNGVAALVVMLKHNMTITNLNLSEHCLTEREVLGVLELLQYVHTKAKIRLCKPVLKSSTAVARALATLHTKRPDILVHIFFDPTAKTAYQEQIQLLKSLQPGPIPLETAKVFMCGDYGIGKTTMIESLAGSYFRQLLFAAWQPRDDPDRPNERTPGIRVCEMKLQDTTSHTSDEVASLRVYDFGGQWAYHVIHTLMMSDRFAAFVVCVDLSQPEQHVKEHVNYWLRFICTRLQQGVAAATATADGDGIENTKPRVLIVGTKRDLAFQKTLVDERGQPPWGAAMVAHLKRTFGGIVDIQDPLISLNCYQSGEAGFIELRAQLFQHWCQLKERKLVVPRVVDLLATTLQSARKEKPAWTIDALFQFTLTHAPGLGLTSFGMPTFYSALRYLHARGDLLWYSNNPSLQDSVFVDPNWLLHDVLGRALTPDGVQQGSITTKGVVTFTDLETAFDGVASADLVINVLQHTLLCFELSPSDDGQRRFMLPSRVEEEVDLATAWSRSKWPLYAGRRLVVENHALALPPGFFPHVQTLLHKSFGATLKVWQDAFFCKRDGVQCLGLLRDDREVDVWVRASAGAECSAWSCMMEIVSFLQEDASGIDHVQHVLSVNHLQQHHDYPASRPITDLEDLALHDLVDFADDDNPPTRLGDLLVHNPILTARWHQPGHEWHHPRWRLDDSFDRSLQWTGPGAHGVYSVSLPPDTDLYRWIESQMTSGLTLSRVEMTKSTTMLRAFQTQVQRSATRRGDTEPSNPFNQDFGASDPEKRAMLDRLKTQFARTPGGVNHVNVLVAWHGCDEAVAGSISACGAANFSSPGDRGFFGSGIYLTPQASYAAGYSTRLLTGGWRPPNADGEHVLLLCASSVGLAYPITRAADYPHGSNECSYYGKPFDESQDTHYVQVTRTTNFQATRTAGTFDFEEYVFSQEVQVLPFAKVFVKVRRDELRAHLESPPSITIPVAPETAGDDGGDDDDQDGVEDGEAESSA
ncbi:hypothetical protein PTSG_13043 [Salpingoeca rosetta]|uniref:Uncharacterized protein n=1 Tax=Salpingoeca rosetta (strain ATCC 50818 / BSB-021) TaxID=946362 RepID=F2UPL2_SALR5|nr:uncharacterized protein PTSG_13043 [Salpingoeca rosetta]EGD79567.1 hypothetical protein PTSG_13043 [Salpingoeca rosetta]|eukprot:XP_004988795.1 hypothetical protein PTSG_13043 [Salpingoeca rosetta]